MNSRPDRRRRWKRTPRLAFDDEWFSPRGRWCLIAQCTRCGMFCRDTVREGLLRNRKWGEAIRAPTRTNGHYGHDNSGLCESCIHTCDACGTMGTKKTTHYRSDVFAWNWDKQDDYHMRSKDMLCTGCWNKARAIKRKQQQADECRTLLNKLIRSISDERKHTNHWANAEISGINDGGR